VPGNMDVCADGKMFGLPGTPCGPVEPFVPVHLVVLLSPAARVRPAVRSNLVDLADTVDPADPSCPWVQSYFPDLADPEGPADTHTMNSSDWDHCLPSRIDQA